MGNTHPGMAMEKLNLKERRDRGILMVKRKILMRMDYYPSKQFLKKAG